MASLTTPQVVRDRIGFTTADLTDEVLQKYIDDAQAYIEAYANKIFTVGEPKYKLASAVCSDMAAMYAIVRLSGGKTAGLNYSIDELRIDKKEQLDSRLRIIFELKMRAKENLSLLLEEDILLPTTSTYEAG